MPGEAARNAEAAGGVFAAPVLRELHRLGCRGVHLLPVPAPGGPEWVDAPPGLDGTLRAGWRFGVRDAAGQGFAVVLEFDDPDALPPSTRDALARNLAATAALASSGLDAGAAVLVDREAMARQMHDLRNALNSLLMNAAVLAAKLPPADREGRFARQVQADGERCTALLQALAEGARRSDGPMAR